MRILKSLNPKSPNLKSPIFAKNSAHQEGSSHNGLLSANSNPKELVPGIIIAIACAHFLNDVMQSMLPALYPILSINYQLSLLQIGIITATYQITGSILQPLIGLYTDKHPLPRSLLFSACFTMIGLFILAEAHHYSILLIGAACIGLGSSIFHPEASRVTRLAAGSKFGFAQSIFQLGGNSGSALGPLLAALFISQQTQILWFMLLAFIGFTLLLKVSFWYSQNIKKNANVKKTIHPLNLSHSIKKRSLIILMILMTTKYMYLSSMSNFYTFFSINKFGVSTTEAQYLLFLYLAGIATGTLFGGIISDHIGTRRVIWVSILGVLPFTLALPHCSLPVMAFLSVIIGIILASAFPAMIVFAQELMPDKIGTIAGLFFGFAFGIGGIASVILGFIGDFTGTENLFILCSFLPILGIVAIFLPKLNQNP